jgi:hypothetical protein
MQCSSVPVPAAPPVRTAFYVMLVLAFKFLHAMAFHRTDKMMRSLLFVLWHISLHYSRAAPPRRKSRTDFASRRASADRLRSLIRRHTIAVVVSASSI